MGLRAGSAKSFNSGLNVPVTTNGLFVNAFDMKGTLASPLGTAVFKIPFRRVPACLGKCCGCGTNRICGSRGKGVMGSGGSA